MTFFDHASFAYNTGETVLKDVSFTARQGEVIALAVPSGGGKTSAFHLAARFWDAAWGRITVGGINVSQTDSEMLGSLYSIVFQDVAPQGKGQSAGRAGKRAAFSAV